MKKQNATSARIKLAKNVLQDRMVSPREIRDSVFWVEDETGEEMRDEVEEVYTKDMTEDLRESFPSLREISLCYDGNFSLLPGPPYPIPFSEMFEMFPEYLGYCGDHDLLSLMVGHEEVLPGWMMVQCSSEKDDSFGTDWYSRGEITVPNITELLWCSIVLVLTRGKIFPNGECVRSSSSCGLDRERYCLEVEKLIDDRLLLQISPRPDWECNPLLGTASKIPLSQGKETTTPLLTL